MKKLFYKIKDNISTLNNFGIGYIWFRTLKGAKYYKKIYKPTAQIEKVKALNQYTKSVYIND